MQTDFKTEYKTIVKAPLEKVWEALTNSTILKQYFFGTQMITDWEVGGDIVFQGEWEGQKYKDHGKVLEFKPNEKLSYTYLSSWANMEDIPENYVLVNYEVKPVENGTELTISQTNYDEEKAQHSEGSWAALMDEMKKIIE